MELKDYFALLFKSGAFWSAVIALLNAVGAYLTVGQPALQPIVLAFNGLIVAVAAVFAGVQLNAARVAAKADK